jgi:hypothetical protein
MNVAYLPALTVPQGAPRGGHTNDLPCAAALSGRWCRYLKRKI